MSSIQPGNTKLSVLNDLRMWVGPDGWFYEREKMEVLGKTEVGYIISVTNRELANLAGNSSGYSNLNGISMERLAVGAKIEIGAIYERASKIIQSFSEVRTGLDMLKTSSEVLLGFIDERTIEVNNLKGNP
jgi:hypothetical protein